MTDEHHIKNYVGGEQRGREANRLERESLNDPFLAEALDGFEQQGWHGQAIENIRDSVTRPLLEAYHKRQRQQRQRIYYVWAIAASLVVYLGITFFVDYGTKRSGLALLDRMPAEDRNIPEVISALPLPLDSSVFLLPVGPDVIKENDIVYVGEKVILADEAIVSPEDDAFLAEEIMDYVVIAEKKLPKEEFVEEEIPFAIVEEKPVFAGGEESAFTEWIYEHTTYPEKAREGGVQGRVIVQFVVNTKGKVMDVKVLRGIDPLLDREAVRVISMSPGWAPGKQGGKEVAVKYIIPVTFKLR